MIFVGLVREKNGVIDKRIPLDALMDGIAEMVEKHGSFDAARAHITKQLEALKRQA